MSTIPSVQLFRNSRIITGRTNAINALEAQKASVPDGGLILARYSIDGEDNNVKTLLGIVRKSGSGNADLTIIDVEGAAEKVQSAITSAINSLNKVDAEVEGEYVSSVSEENGIITVSRQALPSLGKQTSSGKAITAITQTKGLVSVEFGGVAAANVSVVDASNKFTATTVEDVLVEIQNSLDAAIGSGGSVGTQISNAISGISGTTTITDGKVITAISQTDGKVSVSASTISADKVSASTIASSTTTVAVTGTKVSEQIASLATSIKTVSGDAKSYSIEAISGEELTALGANVREAYKLVDEDGAKAGAPIKIYRDSSLKSVALDGQTLNFTYILADGSESTVGVDVSTFLAESEFKDGLEVVDGIVKVKKDASSEKFLSVSESGVKLDGVQNAINKAAASATTKVEKTGEGSHITVTSSKSDVDGSVTYQISESDIASDNALAQEVADRQAAIAALDLTQVGGNGQVITTISQADGKVSASAIDLTANNVKATESTGVPTAVDVTGETVSEQIASLATSIKSASTAAAAAHTEVKPKTDEHVRVSVSKSSDNTHDVVTITEDDIASATALEDETTNRQNADTELSNKLGTGVSIAEGKTVTEQLQALSGRTGDASGVTSVEGAKAYAKDLVDNLKAEVGSTTGTSKTEAIKIVQTNGKIASITLGAFDCGTYN